ncbi:MAG: PD40 domain-containing protein, partial [Bacteroidetes bacterium]|nr:PD40 domain-containing protein [Bacteroidota bacterium]
MKQWKVIIISLGIFILIGQTIGQKPALVLPMNDRLIVSPMDVLNSPFREGNLSITPDGNTIFFTS